MSSEPKTRGMRYEPRIVCGQDGLHSRPFNKTHGTASVASSGFRRTSPNLPCPATPALQAATTFGATIRPPPREDPMATDYDASRKTEEEQKEESLEARRLTSGEQDKTSGKVDEDEAELAESYELPGADLSHETLSIEVTPKQTDEFTCTSCFLVQHESRRSSPAVDLCNDCA